MGELLRQPHPFQGFLLRAEDVPGQDSPVSKLSRLPHRLFDADAADRASHPEPHDKPAPKRPDLLRLPLEVFEGLPDRPEQVPHAVVSGVALPVGLCDQRT